VPGESTNWLPPYAVHASTKTTTHAGASPPANSASTASGNVGRNGERLCHMGLGARVALDDVDGRIAPLGILVVAWRHIDLDRALGGIAQRVVRQQLADDDMPIETALEGSLIGIGKRRPVDHGLGHARDATAPARTRVRALVATTTRRRAAPCPRPVRNDGETRTRPRASVTSSRTSTPTSRRAPLI
jgi:hypothetical protein